MIRVFLILLILSVLVSCNQKKGINKFSDDTIVKIAEFQDRRLSDSLYQFFNHENPAYRKDAVLAFASIQDTLAIGRLAEVLKNDADMEVRSAAAFALGQTGSQKSFQALLEGSFETRNDTVLREIFEAFGKTALPENFFNPKEPMKGKKAEGFAWFEYRLGLRGIADSMAVLRSIDFINDKQDLETRLGASHFFCARTKKHFSGRSNIAKSCVIR